MGRISIGIMLRSLRTLGIAAALSGASAPAALASGFASTITDLGTLPGATDSVATGLNNRGQVVGQSGGTTFLYSGVMTPSDSTLPLAVNDSHQLASGVNGFVTFAMNISGAQAGFTTTTGALGQAATLVNGVVTPVPGTPINESVAYGINNSGAVVGTMETRSVDLMNYHPFLYANGKLTDIGASLPNGSTLAAYAINNLGQVVGGNYQGYGHAFLYSNGTMTDLGTLGGNRSQATGINDLGQIIGTSFNSLSVNDAFLYQYGKMIDLTELVKSMGGMRIENLVGINDAGQIAFNADLDGHTHAYLLSTTTVPEPTCLAVLAAGSVGVLLDRRRRARFKRPAI